MFGEVCEASPRPHLTTKYSAVAAKAFAPNSLSESEARVTSASRDGRGESAGVRAQVPCRLRVPRAPRQVQRVCFPLASRGGDVTCGEGDSRLVCAGSLCSARGVSADKMVTKFTVCVLQESLVCCCIVT